MISFLSGTVIDKNQNDLVLLVNGVGYQVITSPKTSTKIKLNQANVELYIYTHVREDTLSLYGFLDKSSKDIFTLLLSVSGVGPKIALAIEAAASSRQIESAIRAADVDFFTHIPGLGKKSSQRIIVDLKSKLGDLKDIDLTDQAEDFVETTQALKSLGFSAKEAKEAIGQVKNKSNLNSEEIIRQALKSINSSPTETND